MALNASNFVVKGPIRSADMKQFVDLFTGVMTDQPVTFKNAVAIGSSQGATTTPLSLYGAVGQTNNLINLYPSPASLTPTFGFAAYGQFSWGAGGTALQDTFLSRIATQNGHVTDTAGLLVDPHLEVTGSVQATTYAFTNGTTLGTDGAFSVIINRDLTLQRRLNLPYASGIPSDPVIQMTNAGFISSKDHLGNIIPVFATSTDDYNSFYMGPSGALFVNSANSVRAASISPTGDGNFRSLTVSDGSNGVITARNGSLYLRGAGGGNYSAVFDTGSAGVICTAGPIQAPNSYMAAGPVISGGVGDLNANRGNGTGYLFLANASHYVGFDGTAYVMPTSGLNVGGLINTPQVILAGASNTPGSRLAFPQEPVSKINYYDAGGGNYFGTGINSAELYICVPTGNQFVWRANNGGGAIYAGLDGNGNWFTNFDIKINPPRVLSLGSAIVSPGTNIGKSADTVYLSAHAYVYFDLGVGHVVTCQQLIQTSDPSLKQNATIITDPECTTRIRQGMPVYTYQLPPPNPMPDPPPPYPTPNDIGFMADDVHATNPEFSALDNTGKAVGVNYANMSAVLWGALRDLDRRCTAFGI